jgi:hypothetical protein
MCQSSSRSEEEHRLQPTQTFKGQPQDKVMLHTHTSFAASLQHTVSGDQAAVRPRLCARVRLIGERSVKQCNAR